MNPSWRAAKFKALMGAGNKEELRRVIDVLCDSDEGLLFLASLAGAAAIKSLIVPSSQPSLPEGSSVRRLHEELMPDLVAIARPQAQRIIRMMRQPLIFRLLRLINMRMRRVTPNDEEDYRAFAEACLLTFGRGTARWEAVEQRRQAGRVPKYPAAVQWLIAEKLRRAPKLSSSELWRLLLRECDGDGREVHLADAVATVTQDLANGGAILLESNDRNLRKVTQRSFRVAVTRVRKELHAASSEKA